MAANDFRGPAGLRPRGMWVLAAAVFAGLAAISLGYGPGYDFDCRAKLPAWVCQALSLAVPRVLCALSLCGLLAALRPELRRGLSAMVRPSPAPLGLAALAAGFLLVLAPLLWLWLSGVLLPVPALLACWGAGMSAGLLGGALAVFDPGLAGRKHLPGLVLPFAFAAAFGLVLPDLALAIQPAWKIDAVTRITFGGVVWLLELMGQNVTSDLAEKAIRIDRFGVLVGPQCSGVEGFAIISAFTLFYLALFRGQLILRRAWLLLPVALLLSWALNILRITLLILVGRHVSPELAANGFHSQAGWLAFLALALVVALAAHSIPWLQRDPAAVRPARPGFFDDPAVAMILPFAAFMATASLVPALSEIPELLYPGRAAAVAAVLFLCRRPLLALAWRADPVSIAAGLAIGGIWIATAPAAAAGDTALSAALAGLGPAAFWGWVACRVLGTSLLVPAVEELFFRGYLQSRLALGPGPAWRWGAIAVSALLFGLLHDRIIAGTAAGAVFGLLALRRGGVADAIQSHAAANAAIAAAAMLSGAWHLI
ncbi:exosortase E/protease, VPEID-CTERM system [Mangrovicoccus sp. HB161399]|uniref:exosortase E/protease, VPEID-CTERM system n=1 Tax=Mangrovicoccus sp. HB161399 TaxID=2720392 RepID=UPI0015569BDA|nr:exosortase E/protease, VPEID-CTERM system [Mangrovicoccus sp. HB161399]